jgi:transposase
MIRKAYPSDLDDEAYNFMVSYFILLPEHAPQRKYPLREVLNALFWIARTGSQWEYLPHDFPPYKIVHEQAMRWFERGCFENLLHDLRILIRKEDFRDTDPSAVIIDSRTLQSTPESGHRAGYDGGKKKKGTKIHMAVDTLGNVISLLASPANEQDRAAVSELCLQVQQATSVHVEVAFADQGYTGERTALDAAESGIELIVVKRPEGEKGFILLPKRWVVERSFAWFSRFRRLGRDLERLESSLLGFHFVAACILSLNKLHPL